MLSFENLKKMLKIQLCVGKPECQLTVVALLLNEWKKGKETSVLRLLSSISGAVPAPRYSHPNEDRGSHIHGQLLVISETCVSSDHGRKVQRLEGTCPNKGRQKKVKNKPGIQPETFLLLEPQSAWFLFGYYFFTFCHIHEPYSHE